MGTLTPRREAPAVATRLRFRVLGPLEVDAGSGPLPLGGPKQRAVLAHLMIRANEVVSADGLAEHLWGPDPPETARKVIQTYVSHLRKVLGADRIESRAPGYVLRLDPSELDATRFESIVRDARTARASDPSLAVDSYEDALRLWRGPALSDLADRDPFLAETVRLNELRLEAQEGRIEALLETGADQRAIGELEALLADDPLRESLWGFLIIALYRRGRQGEALEAFRRAREILAEELGIDPSPDLVRLHERVLRQDPSLDVRGEPLRGYRLLEKIDEGSTGNVFRAIQPQTSRDVAVKVFHEDLASDTAFVRRFEPDARAVAALEHPHIVPVYDFWREPGLAYVVSRYVSGGSLRAAHGREESPDTHAVLVFVEQVANALAFAHRQGVTHGNLDASAILLDADGNAYLGDFLIGTGRDDDAARDVRDLLELTADRLPTAMPGPLAELADRADRGTAIAASEVVDAVRASLGATEIASTAPADERNPFKGLRPFTEADAHDFYGRTSLTERILSRLRERPREARFLAVVGPSGSGKSSLVRAGVIPAIRAGAIEEQRDWFVAEMFPGRHPLEELASALIRISTSPSPGLDEQLGSSSRGLLDAVDRALPPHAELALVVDQFEEVFTLCADPAERELFLESLRVAAADPDGRLHVIVTLRADFYDRPLTYPRFGELLARRTEAVPPLTADELELAIRAPARAVGVAVEPGLVAAMIADIAHQPGALPSLQFALTELFERREENHLTLDAYRSMDGIAGALSTRADRDYTSMDVEGRRATRQVFLRLVTLGEGRGDTRRRVTRAELDALELDQDATDAVIETFGRHRLLTFDREPATRQPTVEIAHEALLSAWQRLARWIDEAREDLRLHRRLAQAAGEWRASGDDPSFLLRGGRLEHAEAWAGASDLTIGRHERSFLAASIADRERQWALDAERDERESRTERRAARRLRGLVVVLTLAALVASALTLVAVDQRREASLQSRLAFARELAAASIANLDVDAERSILLAREAVRLTRNVDGGVLPEAEAALHQAVGASRVLMTIPGVGGSVAWGAGVFATEAASAPGSVDLRDATMGAVIHTIEAHDGEITGVVASPDGSRFATTGVDGRLRVWDVDGAPITTVTGRGEAVDPSFGAHGTLVAARWTDPKTVRVADTASGDVLRSFGEVAGEARLSPRGDAVGFLTRRGGVDVGVIATLAEDDRALANDVVIAGASQIAWSANDRYVASGGLGGASMWDARTGRPLYPLVGHPWVDRLAWGPHTSVLALAGEESPQITVWEIGDAAALRLTLSSLETADGTDALAFSPDGTRLIATAVDGTVAKVWDVGPRGDAEVFNVPTIPSFGDVAFTNDGLVAADADGHVRVWDLGSGVGGNPVGPTLDTEHSFAVSPDRTMIAFHDGSVWNTETGAHVVTLPGAGDLDGIGWSPDDRLLAVTAPEATQVFDLEGDLIASLPLQRDVGVWMARFSPDGNLVATIDGDDAEGSQIAIWDWRRERVVRTMRTEFARSVTFDPSGSRLVTGFGAASIWDVATGSRLGTLEGYPKAVGLAVFSPDGSRIAAGDDDSVRVFDAASGRQTLQLLGAAPTSIARVAFSPDGSMLASQAPGDAVRVWALDVDTLLTVAERNVTRSLTDSECRRFLHVAACGATTAADPQR